MINRIHGNIVNIREQHEITGITYPAGSLLLRRDEWAALGITEESEPAPAPLTQAEILSAAQQRLTRAVQIHLDTIAQSYRYDNIHTACGWADSFPDATALKTWGAACWATAGQIEAEVIAGTRAIPTGEELVALLPVFIYP